MTASHVSVSARHGTPQLKCTTAGSADGPAFEVWTVRGSRAPVFAVAFAAVALALVFGFDAVALSAVVLRYRIAEAPPSDEPAADSAGLLAVPDLVAGSVSADPAGFVEPVWNFRGWRELGDRYAARHSGEPHWKGDRCSHFGLADASPDSAAGWWCAGPDY